MTGPPPGPQAFRSRAPGSSYASGSSRGLGSPSSGPGSTYEPGPGTGPVELVPEPRLLAGVPPRGTWQGLAEHRRHYARPPAPKSRPWGELIDAVQQAGLRGRGGAGFPAATKMRAVTEHRGRPIVVVNGTEGEPASYKDRMLMITQPHLVIDGALLAAAAVGAEEVVIGVEETAAAAVAALNRALDERAAEEPCAVPVRIAPTPPGYVTGEETALVQYLNGGSALPTAAPPRPFERGVAKRPTLIHNVETLAHLTQIARDGAGWFRRAGTPDEPGTMLLTLSGAVAHRGVLEVPVGTPLSTVIEQAGPLAAPSAVLVGGFFGTWVPPEHFRAPISRSGLAPVGAAPGAGVVIVLPEGACGLAETVRIMCWYANESAGQCGPCSFGLPAIAREAASLCYGPVPPTGLDRLERWGGEVYGRGACKHPDGAVRLMRSALRTFASDIDRHLRGHPCQASFVAPVLTVPGVEGRPIGPPRPRTQRARANNPDVPPGRSRQGW